MIPISLLALSIQSFDPTLRREKRVELPRRVVASNQAVEEDHIDPGKEIDRPTSLK